MDCKAILDLKEEIEEVINSLLLLKDIPEPTLEGVKDFSLVQKKYLITIISIQKIKKQLLFVYYLGYTTVLCLINLLIPKLNNKFVPGISWISDLNLS